MARRKLQEVDASSIADIAFILLAFIIIVTTLEKESGVPAVLPQKRDINAPKPPPIKERNILEILVNSSDRLMIEKEWDKSVEDIPEIVKEFMTNPRNSEDLPLMETVTEEICKQKIAILKANVEAGDNSQSPLLKKWENKLEAVKLIGSYETVNKFATIAIQYDKGTSYGTYLEVRDHIMKGLNELRNQKSLNEFNIRYSDLESIRAEIKTEEDKAKIRAIRQVFPQKIIKLPTKNVL